MVLGLSLIKHLWDHVQTILKDNTYNNEKYIKIDTNGAEKNIKSKDISVGDVIKLQKNQRIPVLQLFKFYIIIIIVL